MVAPVGANPEMGFAFQQRPLAFEGEAAAEFADAAGIADETVFLDAHRVLSFGLFDGDVADDVGDVADAVDAVAVGTRAPGAGEQLEEDVGLPVFALAADED